MTVCCVQRGDNLRFQLSQRLTVFSEIVGQCLAGPALNDQVGIKEVIAQRFGQQHPECFASARHANQNDVGLWLQGQSLAEEGVQGDLEQNQTRSPPTQITPIFSGIFLGYYDDLKCSRRVPNAETGRWKCGLPKRQVSPCQCLLSSRLLIGVAARPG